MSKIMPFIYDGETVIRTIRQDESVWFVVKDVCNVLGIKLSQRATAGIPEGDVHKMNLPSSSGEQEYLIVNEPGFYRLVFRSNKPAAKAFSDWVYNEVLPSIRKTGSYVGGSGADQSSLRGSNEPLDITQQQVLADKLLLLSESNKFYGYAQSLSYLLSIIKVRDVSELKQSHLPHIEPAEELENEYVAKERKYDEREERKLFKRVFYKFQIPLS